MRKITCALILCIFFILPSLTSGDSVDYSYDDNGRLVRTSNADNIRVLYQYDEVGNLISIFKETSTPQAVPPVLQSIDPDIFLIGNNYNVVITGQNLLTTSSVTSDNPDISIKFIESIDTKIIALLSIAGTASPGQANITVTTSYGSVSMSINLYRANISPDSIALFPIFTASLSVSLTPSALTDVTVSIENKNPDVIDTPFSVTIPAGGAADFTVTALSGGTGIIKIATAEATVFVIGDDSPIRSMPVSVSMGHMPDGSILFSHQVSVEWYAVVNATILSIPVSVARICPNPPVRIAGRSSYSTLQDAYDAALNGDIIQAQKGPFTGTLNINRDISVTLHGGYDCDFTAISSKTMLIGHMTKSSGTFKIGNFILKN
ncbi:MAG: RHS repeat protein [Nitrospirae bacterium]|nr:RHS repeat protein [Nitrospirota bacterium]